MIPHRRRSIWRLAVVALAALLASSSCTIEREAEREADVEPTTPPPTDTAEGSVVPLRIVSVGDSTLALIPVHIAGQGPFTFALDTGASNSVVDQDVADRLELTTVGTTEISGVTGVSQAPTVRVEEWAIGEVELGERILAAIPIPEPSRGQGLQGLLGSDVLSNFGRISIDYEAGELDVAPR